MKTRVIVTGVIAGIFNLAFFTYQIFRDIQEFDYALILGASIYGSVYVHEYAHMIALTVFRIPIAGLTQLFVIFCVIPKEMKNITPVRMFVIAVAGLAASGTLTAAAWQLFTVFGYPIFANLIIVNAYFVAVNAVPLPFTDGGRMLTEFAGTARNRTVAYLSLAVPVVIFWYANAGQRMATISLVLIGCMLLHAFWNHKVPHEHASVSARVIFWVLLTGIFLFAQYAYAYGPGIIAELL